jgi:hypothetical protein
MEVFCASDSGFDFRFLTLYGSHTWNGVYSINRDAETYMGGL